MLTTGNLTVELAGAFRITDPGGCDRTPVADKAQALLLLLLTARHGERTRVALQDMLWSDRASVQACQSLRQALRQIRQSFGPYRDTIQANRKRVWLDIERVNRVCNGSGQLAEGLDIGDPEFEEWLRIARMEFRQPTAPSTEWVQHYDSADDWRPSLAIRRLDAEEPRLDWVADLVADGIAAAIGAQFDAQVVTGRVEDQLAFCHCGIQAFQRSDGIVGVRAILADGSGRRLWSGHAIQSDEDCNPFACIEMMRLIQDFVEAFGGALLGGNATVTPEDMPDRLCRLAVRHIFEMTPEDAEKADRLLDAAIERSRRPGLYIAWRAQLRIVELIERYKRDDQSLEEESEALVSDALHHAPGNAMVLALASNVYCFMLQRPERSLDYAGLSLRLDPSNPMAWWASSSSHLYLGNAERALSHARRAKALATGLPHQYWWEQQVASSLMVSGRIKEALDALKRTHSLAPRFKPALRYLIGLSAVNGAEAAANAALNRLRLIEPGFTVDHLVRDDTYPASLLRRTPQIALDRLAAMA